MLPIRLMLVAGSLLAVATAAHAQDAVKVSPHLYKVLLENDQVRVIEFRAKPGQKEAMHSHPAAVVYLLSTGKSRSTTPDGRSEIFEGKAGTSVWTEPMTHSWETMGPGEEHTIMVEMKKPAAAAAPAKKKP